jgi:hypothetical protein
MSIPAVGVWQWAMSVGCLIAHGSGDADLSTSCFRYRNRRVVFVPLPDVQIRLIPGADFVVIGPRIYDLTD